MSAATRRTAAIVLSLVGVSSAAHAIAPRGIRAVDEDGLIAMPDAGVKAPVRRAISVSYGTPLRGAAWSRFTATAGGTWMASWDRATAVPSRIWGSGIHVAGASRDPDVAARAARDLITRHLDLLAPGADPADLVLVANHWDGELRSVGFAQYRAGLRVIGGQVSVRIKNDRIFVIASQALPAVAASVPHAKLAPTALTDRARAALDRALVLPASATASAPGPLAILPLVGDHAVLGYRVVAPVRVDAGGEGAWTAFVEPGSGAVVARRQELHYAVGDVRYDVVQRWTGRARQNRPAPRTRLTVAGIEMMSSPTGAVIWAPDAPTQVVTSLGGERAQVQDDSGPLGQATLDLAPSGVAVWSAADDELVDAQINGYIHAGIVREFARTFAPTLPFLDEPVQVVVNIEDECNAYSNGTRIHFFKSSARCQNTARIADVVYHEYGHSMHAHAIIDGVGAFDGAMSEGLSDFLAAAITEDPGMGRGFFHNDDPLRYIDPLDLEYVWPRDIGEIHYTGLIFAGTFWDLRKQLIDDLGPGPGRTLTLKLFYASVQRATDIPSSLIEALAADDNDGDLANGTPHECTIRDIFGLHGMRTVSGRVDAPGAVVATAGQAAAPLQIFVTGLSAGCAGDEVEEVEVEWRPGVGGTPGPGSVVATDADGMWTADLPLPDDGGRVDYQVVIHFADDSEETLPDNAADPWYQMYQGETVPLYCTDFETDPFSAGWQISASAEVDNQNFAWGLPSREFSTTDPGTAYSGQYILNMGLGYDYGNEQHIAVSMPPIDVGQYSDVVLQYRRWLAVEDGFFDHATIKTNGTTAWSNFDSMMGDSSSVHHLDREWRFHSVPLSTRFAGPILNVSFGIESDQGLHFGGWSLDDVCVVANPNAICGDGSRFATEECDDGAANANTPDACRTNCKFPACGDGILDSGEECEPALDANCLDVCFLEEPPDSCCNVGGGSSPGGLLLATGLGLALARRRRRRRRRSA